MFEIIKSGTNIDFMGKRHLWLTVSAVLLAITIVLFFTKGLNYGIDFTGGAEVHIQVPADWDIGKVRDTLSKGGLKDARIVTVGDPGEHRFIVRASGEANEINQISSQIEKTLSSQLQPGQFAIEKVDVVGPAAGKSLRISGFLAMLYAILALVIYVAVRFDIRYTPGIVLAVFHDTLIIIGVFIITQKQFDLQVLAAILALIGYSNNDTIVTYDRVREVAHNNPGMSITGIVNQSINETLSRTFLTAFSTFVSVFALWLFGGTVIRDFAFTLMVGLIIGTYSSIFVASSMVVYFTEWQLKQAAKQKGRPKKTFTPRHEPKFQA